MPTTVGFICESYKILLCFNYHFYPTQEIKQLVGRVEELCVAISTLSTVSPQNPVPTGDGSLHHSRTTQLGSRQQQNALNVLVPSNANASADIGYEMTKAIKAAAFVKDFFEFGLGTFAADGECHWVNHKWRVEAAGKAGKPTKDAKVEARNFMKLFRLVASEAELTTIAAARSTSSIDVQLQLEDRRAAVDAVVERIRDVYLPYLEGGSTRHRTGDTVTALYGRWKVQGYRYCQPPASSSSSPSCAILTWKQVEQVQRDARAAAIETAAVQAEQQGKLTKKKRARVSK